MSGYFYLHDLFIRQDGIRKNRTQYYKEKTSKLFIILPQKY